VIDKLPSGEYQPTPILPHDVPCVGGNEGNTCLIQDAPGHYADSLRWCNFSLYTLYMPGVSLAEYLSFLMPSFFNMVA